MNSKSSLIVERNGEVFELSAEDVLRPGDKITNKGAELASVSTVSQLPDYPSQIAKLKPGASVMVKDAGQPTDAILGLEALDDQAAVEQASAETASEADFVITPEVTELEGAVGLFGAIPFLGGLGAAAAAAGAIGLAALANRDDDDGAAGDGTGGGNANGMGLTGLAGGVAALNDGVDQTALAPLTGVTGPVADGLGQLGGALANSGEPTGLGQTLGAIIGAPTADGAPVQQDGGLVGLVNTVSTGLTDATMSPALEPLAPVIEPLSQTLGSTDGVTDGVAQGLANVGSTLGDSSGPLAPLTADLLGPVVGNSAGQDGGLPQTLTQTGEGLTDLTNPDSAVAPLSALTDPLANQVVAPLADGVEQVGMALAGPAAQDPSGVLPLVADLLGGEATTAPASTSGQPADLLALDGGLPGIGSLAALPGADILGTVLPV